MKIGKTSEKLAPIVLVKKARVEIDVIFVKKVTKKITFWCHLRELICGKLYLW